MSASPASDFTLRDFHRNERPQADEAPDLGGRLIQEDISAFDLDCEFDAPIAVYDLPNHLARAEDCDPAATYSVACRKKGCSA